MLPVLTPLLAVLLAGIVIYRSEKNPLCRPWLFTAASFACGFAAVIAELYVVKRRVLAGDYSGIADTIDAVILICTAIAAVVLLLNLIALALAFERRGNDS